MLEEWCENTSLNGVVDLWIYRKNKCKFSIWLIIMIVMFVMTVYLTVLNLNSFLNAPTVTNIAIIASNSMEMPELLLCYQGGFNVVSMINHGLSDELVSVYQVGYAKESAEIVDYQRLYEEYANFVAANEGSAEWFLTDVAGFKCEDVIMERWLAGDLVTNYGCKNVSQFIGKAGIPCWVFRGNGHQTWPTPSDGGIRLRLKLPLGVKNATNSKQNDPEAPASFSLVIEKRVLIATDQAIDIPINYKVNILMALTVSKLLPTSLKNKCTNDETFTTSSACYQRCLNRLTIEVCNCTYPGVSLSSLDVGFSMCDIFSYKNVCIKKFYNESSWECTKQCRPMCTDYQYQLTVSYLPIAIRSDMTEYSVVTVSFSHMQYTQIEEVDAFTWDVAVANVGGQAGLWLGCSVVTVIQALYYFGLSFFKTNKVAAKSCNKF